MLVSRKKFTTEVRTVTILRFGSLFVALSAAGSELSQGFVALHEKAPKEVFAISGAHVPSSSLVRKLLGFLNLTVLSVSAQPTLSDFGVNMAVFRGTLITSKPYRPTPDPELHHLHLRADWLSHRHGARRRLGQREPSRSFHAGRQKAVQYNRKK